MARPTKNDIDSGLQGWDAKMDDNDEVILNGPFPTHEHVGDETDLATSFPANSYDRCSVMVNHSTLGWSVYYSNGTSWVRVLRLAQPSIPAMVDNSGGGPVNETIQALTDPADTPATADVLRDDLVANLIPELRNNYADLTSKLNEIITVLTQHGLAS